MVLSIKARRPRPPHCLTHPSRVPSLGQPRPHWTQQSWVWIDQLPGNGQGGPVLCRCSCPGLGGRPGQRGIKVAALARGSFLPTAGTLPRPSPSPSQGKNKSFEARCLENSPICCTFLTHPWLGSQLFSGVISGDHSNLILPGLPRSPTPESPPSLVP